MTGFKVETTALAFQTRMGDIHEAIQFGHYRLDTNLQSIRKWSCNWFLICIKNLFSCKDPFLQLRIAKVVVSLEKYLELNRHYLLPNDNGMRVFPSPVMKLQVDIDRLNQKTDGRYREIFDRILAPFRAQIAADQAEEQGIHNAFARGFNEEGFDFNAFFADFGIPNLGGREPARLGEEEIEELKKKIEDTLGVQVNTAEELKKAMRQWARKNHPDKRPNDPEAHNKFTLFGQLCAQYVQIRGWHI